MQSSTPLCWTVERTVGRGAGLTTGAARRRQRIVCPYAGRPSVVPQALLPAARWVTPYGSVVRSSASSRCDDWAAYSASPRPLRSLGGASPPPEARAPLKRFLHLAEQVVHLRHRRSARKAGRPAPLDQTPRALGCLA